MSNITKHQVEGWPVWHITDAYQTDVIRRWTEWYMQAGIKWGWREDPINNVEKSRTETYEKAMLMTPEEQMQIFGPNPYLSEWNTDQNTELSDLNRVRLHTNIITGGRYFYGHTDVAPEDPRNLLISLWFGTPCWDNPEGGMYLGKSEQMLIPNQFNSMILFPAQLWHKTQGFEGTNIRVTVYASYEEHNPGEIKVWQDLPNVFDTDPLKQRNISRKCLRKYGVQMPYHSDNDQGKKLI